MVALGVIFTKVAERVLLTKKKAPYQKGLFLFVLLGVLFVVPPKCCWLGVEHIVQCLF